jgi:hypothetical protein
MLPQIVAANSSQAGALERRIKPTLQQIRMAHQRHSATDTHGHGTQVRVVVPLEGGHARDQQPR